MPTTLTDNALALLKKRYLDDVCPTVDALWDAVSGGNPTFRRLLAELKFLPNSPTLFNMGRNNGCTSSACFVFDIGDYMLYHNGKIMEDSIVRTREKAILVAKAGGGVGYYGSKIRMKGSYVNSIHRVACGPVAVLRDMNAIQLLTTQGGKRELAQMFVLDCDHGDIREYIHCKDGNPQALASFNISVGWKKEWVEGVFNPLSINIRQRELWQEQCTSAWQHGCPGMFFPDRVNEFNPNLHLGRINACNPCGETPNRSDEPCNLGSMSLPRYFNRHNRTVYWDDLYADSYDALCFLDDILDRNVFPHPDITKAALLTRKLGLGAMGWADLLAMMHIHYDTEEALELADRVMRTISDAADHASRDLAMGKSPVCLGQAKGPYEGYCATRTQGRYRRNETTTSIAPTGTIALIAGVWASIEPHLALGDLFGDGLERTTSEGMKLADGINPWVFEQLEGFRPKVASEIAPEWHVKHQAVFQKHTDLGVSKTVNLPKSATVEDVSRIYRMMYESGCKGGTIFREGCREEAVLVRKDSSKSVYSLDPKVTNHDPNLRPRNYTEQRDLEIALGADSTSEQAMREVSERRIQEFMDTPPTPLPIKASDFEFTARGFRLSEEDKAHLERVKSEYQQSLARYLPHPTPPRRKMGVTRPGTIHKLTVAGTEFFLIAGQYDDGSLGEIFICGNFGSTITGLLDTFCITFSVALQSGVPLSTLVAQLSGKRFEPAGMTGDPDVPVCTSVTDYVVRWLEARYLRREEDKKPNATTLPKSEWIGVENHPREEAPTKFGPEVGMVGQILSQERGNPPERWKTGEVLTQEDLRKHYGPGTKGKVSGMVCPDCGTGAVYSAGCLTCLNPSCGWTRCG